jgi:hypothetical protein
METKLVVDARLMGTRTNTRLVSFVVAPAGDGGICGISNQWHPPLHVDPTVVALILHSVQRSSRRF